MTLPHDGIRLEGVRTHNLQNLSLTLPKNRLVVFTGVSGSGKSSLVFDTLFQVAKSLYLGALASTGQELGDADYELDHLSGVQAPVALAQSTQRLSNPRSTVGSMSGMERSLRVLFARLGQPVCPVCLGPTDAQLRCASCGCLAQALTPLDFSAHRKEGMCLSCKGLGRVAGFDQERVIPDPGLSLNAIWEGAEPGTFNIPNVRKAFDAMCADVGIAAHQPFAALSAAQRQLVLYGSPTTYFIQVRKVSNHVRFEGILGYLERLYRETSSAARRAALERYLGDAPCPDCQGLRLRPASLAVRLGGQNIATLQQRPVAELLGLLQALAQDPALPGACLDLLRRMQTQCQHIAAVGLPYLALERSVVSLSGGELQRLLLAQHLSNALSGVMYVLDEPSTGLHPRDTAQLLTLLQQLRDQGNSLMVVEHDETLIRAADWLVEVGPGAGRQGGRLVFEGTPVALLQSSSATARHLGQPLAAPAAALGPRQAWWHSSPLSRHNVQNLSVALPLGAYTCVTGVSGAGKSSLVQALCAELQRQLNARSAPPQLQYLVHAEQKPMARSSRSSLATYVGLADELRDLYAAQPEAQAAALQRSHFSANVAGGRCETCKGQGEIEMDIAFLKNDYQPCPDCHGQRFTPEVLAVQWGGRSISEVLRMSVSEALAHFMGGPAPVSDTLTAALRLLDELGLGYLQLGQSTRTLSGGEAQRLHLASELQTRKSGQGLYVFDEPSRGLHGADLPQLWRLLQRLKAQGHTVLLIEHELSLIACADHVLELGPEGGPGGGQLLYSGPVSGLLGCTHSPTGRVLAQHSALH
ncbi:ATP-binding cassette domain-containing protein [Roseateles sp. BYS180W]|uniref:UvrABC system protein A n=1 Tax=Roseateles rivi TaxID=3299028 RepID=A0ABW7FU01_9BURK